MNPNLMKSALVRAARTFAQTFLSAVAAGAIKVVDMPTGWALVVAAAAGAMALAWRALLDPSSVPSLPDPAPTAR